MDLILMCVQNVLLRCDRILSSLHAFPSLLEPAIELSVLMLQLRQTNF